jgi:hypothetical protein
MLDPLEVTVEIFVRANHQELEGAFIQDPVRQQAALMTQIEFVHPHTRQSVLKISGGG